jgi:predicted dehydrogenase
MVRVGIIGCGKIADLHAGLIQSLPGCEIVGVCDQEELMARQLWERFSIRKHFSDVRALLEDGRPDIVHITTPPQSHFNLGKVCLEAGCHVYVEKPFTVNAQETEELINLATVKGLKITVGHDHQFTHAAIRMRELIKGGYLGGTPVHMESYYGYDLGDPVYARALLGDKEHWVRRLPGKLLHNIISHGIGKISEFLESDDPKVIAYGFTSSFLKRIGEFEIND